MRWAALVVAVIIALALGYGVAGGFREEVTTVVEVQTHVDQQTPSPDYLDITALRWDSDHIVRIWGPDLRLWTPIGTSMSPTVGDGTHHVLTQRVDTDKIVTGSMLVFKAPVLTGKVLHRVVAVGNDLEGWYAITRGDNVFYSDIDLLGKVREEDIEGVVVGILY
jgi:hypothetical protein